MDRIEGGRTHGTPNYAGIPSVVFTTPPLARVGLTEEAAQAEACAMRHTTETRRTGIPRDG